MNEFDQLNENYDDYIKKVVQRDTFVNVQTQKTVEKYIEQSPVKVKKISYSQIKVIAVLAVLLTLSLCYNLYVTFFKDTFPLPGMSTTSQNEGVTNVVKLPVVEEPEEEPEEEPKKEEKEDEEDKKDKDKDEEKEDTKNTVKNEVTNTANENTVAEDNENTTPPANIASVDNGMLIPTSITGIKASDLDELEAFIQKYGFTINRVNYEEETVESDTMLLVYAKKFFDSVSEKTVRANPNISYTPTADNLHKFLAEISTRDYTRQKVLDTYKNVIQYNGPTNSYVFGDDSKVFDDEKYICSDIQITDQDGDTYTGTCKVRRLRDIEQKKKGKVIVNTEETVYEVTLKFKFNANYSYQRFKIVSLKANNTSFYPDNTRHLQ